VNDCIYWWPFICFMILLVGMFRLKVQFFGPWANPYKMAWYGTMLMLMYGASMVVGPLVCPAQ
jgi:hypothetical protein